MSHSVYPYSQGDRLSDRNTYFYSEFHGPAFFEAWRASRAAALAALPWPLPLSAPPRAAPDGVVYDTAQLLAEMLNSHAEDHLLLDRLLQRFEVSKRLYRKYDLGLFKAIRDSGYHDLDLYLLFGALCVQCQNQRAAMRFLNALLKAVDSLISVLDRLDPEQGAHLAWLIGREREWVQRIAAAVGVELNP